MEPPDDKNLGGNEEDDPEPDENGPDPDPEPPLPPARNKPCLLGNPCNPVTGNKYQEEEDLPLPGTGLSFVRSYNSQFGRDVGLGFGWTSSMHPRIEISSADPTMVVARRADGGARPFTCRRTGATCGADADSPTTLFKSASGYTLSYPKGTLDEYDAGGRLIVRKDKAGNTLTYSYDVQGRLSAVAGPYGHTLSFSYDAAGHLNSVTGPMGKIITYAYDDKQNLVRVTSPDATYRAYHYENSALPHHLTGITDENGIRYATYAYDKNGRVTLSQHAVTDNSVPQERFTFSYGINQTFATNAADEQLALTYQVNLGLRNIVSTGHQTGTVSRSYDANNNLLSVTDEAGRVATYVYNSANQPISVTEASGTTESRTKTYSYLAPEIDLPTSIQGPSVYANRKGKTLTQITYNAQRKPTQIVESGYTPSGVAISRAETFAYNNRGQVLSVDGPRTDASDVTLYAYYDCATGVECGRIKSITNALGQVTAFDAYDGDGRLLEMTDPNGLKTLFSYDLRGRWLSVTEAAPGLPSKVTQYTYDAAGNRVRMVTPDNVTLTYVYDAAHDLRSISDTLGNKVEYKYDAKGNRSEERFVDPNGTLVRTLQASYDHMNRISSITEGSSKTTFSYSPVGNLSTSANPKGSYTSYSYDARNRRTSSAMGSINTTYGYNVHDKTSQVTAPNGAATSYVYDDLGNLLQEQSPDRGTISYTHDAAGNVKTETNALGVTASYSYDALNRVVAIDYPGTDEDVTFVYDIGPSCENGIGRLCRVADASGTTEFAYDPFGNIVEQRMTELGVTYVTRYVYDLGNRIASITYPDGRIITYTRDSVGRVSGIAATIDGLSTNLATGLAYRADGLLSSLAYGNLLTETRQHDLRGVLTSANASDESRAFEYDLNGNLTWSVVAGQTGQSYTYDFLNRLTQDVSKGVSYTYDSNGNRLTAGGQSYAYETASNRLAAAGGTGFNLDAAGNTIAAGTLGFTYNTAGRLAAVQQSGSSLAQYTYGANGLRSRKQVGGATTVYHYDLEGRLLLETDASGGPIRAYVWADHGPIAQIDRGTTDRVSYLHLDHLGTSKRATNSAGTTVWRAENDAFYTMLPNEDPDQDGTLTTVNLRFPGQYYDQETGLHYNWNRYYDPKTGRYITSDPIGLFGGLNTYIYVANNPLRYDDPLGLVNVAPEFGGGPSNRTHYPPNFGSENVPMFPSLGQLEPIGKIVGAIVGVPAAIGAVGATAPVLGEACLTAAQAAASSQAAKNACLALGICSSTARGEILDDLIRDFARREQLRRTSEIVQQTRTTLGK